MRKLLAVLALAALATPVLAQDVAEPRSGKTFAPKLGESSLLGVALRTKTFLHIKVYAIGLYVADSALSGPLAAHKGKTDSPAFYSALVSGDFPKTVSMKFIRDIEAEKVRDAFRESLEKADKKQVESFVSYFADVKEGNEWQIAWESGGTLSVVVAGQARPKIADQKFAAAVFGIWLGEKPIQEDIKRDLVARAAQLIK